jgi:hypothetical protein
MSKSGINDFVWAEMGEAQKVQSVSTGRATLKQMVEGLLDGSANLREVCRVSLANSDVCLEPTQLVDAIDSGQHESSAPNPNQEAETSEESMAAAAHGMVVDGARKRRQGLPEGYVPRLYKH